MDLTLDVQPIDLIIKRIPGYPGYLACNQGNVWTSRGHGLKKLSKWFQKYARRWYVTASVGPKKLKYPVSHFVLRAFHPRDDAATCGLICRHLDGNALNDAPENLAWGTHQENMQDVLLHGVRTLDPELVRRIRTMALSGMRSKEIAGILGLKGGNVQLVINGKTASYVPNEDGSPYVATG